MCYATAERLFTKIKKKLTLTTPGGQPAWLSISINIIVAPGSLSDGLMMLVLPHVMATGNIHNGIMAGKLNGVMPAVTPERNLSDVWSVAKRVAILAYLMAEYASMCPCL